MTNFKRHLAALATGIAATALLAGAAFADPALIYDGGGKFDKSFNEAAFNGAEKYKTDNSVEYRDFEIQNDAQREQALRKFAATVPPAGTNVILVTHKPNILDAFGKDWFEVKEGEASVFKPDGNGFKPVVRVQADEWAKLAATN